MDALTDIKENEDVVYLKIGRVYSKELFQKHLNDTLNDLPEYKVANEVLAILESSEHLDFAENLYDDVKFLKYAIRLGDSVEGRLKDLLQTLTEDSDVIPLSEHIPLAAAKLKDYLLQQENQ